METDRDSMRQTEAVTGSERLRQTDRDRQLETNDHRGYKRE